jgi:hypothetical protein
MDTRRAIWLKRLSTVKSLDFVYIEVALFCSSLEGAPCNVKSGSRYFERVREAWNPKAQEEIASTCLTYLSFHTFDTSHCYGDGDFSRRITQNPFLDYAARYWGNHALAVQQTIRSADEVGVE